MKERVTHEYIVDDAEIATKLGLKGALVDVGGAGNKQTRFRTLEEIEKK